MSLWVRALSATAILLALTISASAADDIQERTIRWGHLNNTDHPVSFGVQKFAEILLAKSGGKMKVREFAASQLGNELQQGVSDERSFAVVSRWAGWADFASWEASAGHRDQTAPLREVRDHTRQRPFEVFRVTARYGVGA